VDFAPIFLVRPRSSLDAVHFITPSGRGIGLATAQRFVDEGAYVFITGLHQRELDIAVNQIGKKSLECSNQYLEQVTTPVAHLVHGTIKERT
jgi:NAD(P)-dependent dehydrogenase (short-subunit alcohol dehydrogenase family)